MDGTNFTALAYKVCKYDKIVFYGTGYAAKILYKQMKKIGLVPDFCVVTRRTSNDPYFMDAVPIYQVDEHLEELKKEDTVVLVAATPKFEKDIESILRGYGIKNYLLLSKFSVFHEYKTKSVAQCIEEIVKWNVFVNHKNGKDADAIKRSLTEKIKNPKTINNRIVFAVGALTPRVLKIATALRNEGKELKIYMYPSIEPGTLYHNWLQKLGIPCFKFVCVEELMYELIMDQAEIIHFFSCRDNTVIPYVLIKMKEIFSSHIVYDEYDIVNEFYHGYGADMLEEERFCLEHADGVCNRGYELDYLSQQCGYHFEGKTIQFMDYCNDKAIEQMNV